ncbi:hypothetical protein DOTSEDRAFT_73048 [Dothistroma septosporum NZE10]|uniref:C2H2-type domain-containing protein n=1 Tax=Dothistroma septosporum (strain NZE10 / CBS 128990) TaxID=675120 RepID=N1PJ42_DOTSN|nr:hypothetical protein DOTSEDRAFT_73048 [Dothistroma septosporum NZE10]
MLPPFPCAECNKAFTRSENLERHLRSRHRAAHKFVCERCGRTFARSDVRKRHAERCARGLHRRRPRTPVADHAEIPCPSTRLVPLSGTFEKATRSDLPNDGRQDASDEIPVGHTDCTFEHDFLPSISNPPATPMRGLFAAQDDRSPGPVSFHVSMSNDVFPSADTSSHAACYFQHFHPFLPIIHEPTFRLSTAPSLLASIVVAVGKVYMPDSGRKHQANHDLWRSGVDELLSLMKENSALPGEPWFLQAWLLHTVYGFYFTAESSSASRNMLHVLVDQMRSMCLLKQGLTYSADVYWTNGLSGPEELPTIWPVYVHQESFRLCVLALLFIDTQMASPCNVRPVLSTTEVLWDIPHTGTLWHASSADEWVTAILDEVQVGNITCTSPSNNQDLLHPAMVIQHLMSGSADTRLLRRLASHSFGTVCVLASLDALVRDFTYCYYQMPTVLADPSAFHILAPSQNQAITAAVHAMLERIIERAPWTPQTSRLMKLTTWTVRLGLTEPDDLLVAGIAETDLAAGLATSTHCMIGSMVAKRRAAPLRHRPFGEDSSLVCWQDLLSSIGLIVESTQDAHQQQPPWMTALSYRVLLILWRTLRRATADSERPSDALNPAKIIIPLIHERVRSYLRREDGMSDLTKPASIEASFVSLLEQIFGNVDSPVSNAIEGILSEIKDVLASVADGLPVSP